MFEMRSSLFIQACSPLSEVCNYKSYIKVNFDAMVAAELKKCAVSI